MKIQKGYAKCATCKKLFWYNPQSIYKLNKGGGTTKNFCSYTCWRKAGGDK